MGIAPFIMSCKGLRSNEQHLDSDLQMLLLSPCPLVRGAISSRLLWGFLAESNFGL